MSSKPHHDKEASAIERSDNNKIITIRPRGFNIVWGNDRRYWHLPDGGNKDSPAKLVQVSWLEVTGSESLESGMTYEISFNVSFNSEAFGWSGCPVYMMAKIGKRGKYMWKKIESLDRITSRKDIPEDKLRISVPKEGEHQLFFGLYEVWSGKWKGGLQIHHATIKPSSN